jgi:hypothetical protein
VRLLVVFFLFSMVFSRGRRLASQAAPLPPLKQLKGKKKRKAVAPAVERLG